MAEMRMSQIARANFPGACELTCRFGNAHVGCLVYHFRHSKVDEFQHVVLIDKAIVRFDVTFTQVSRLLTLI